jgi:hypothetical protein
VTVLANEASLPGSLHIVLERRFDPTARSRTRHQTAPVYGDRMTAWGYRLGELLDEASDTGRFMPVTISEDLLRAGEEGWEAVTMTSSGGRLQVLLKRPLLSEDR